MKLNKNKLQKCCETSVEVRIKIVFGKKSLKKKITIFKTKPRNIYDNNILHINVNKNTFRRFSEILNCFRIL